MLLLWAGLLMGAGDASSGPDLSERATPVVLPISDVVVFSDRARVTRKGSVRLTGGVQVVAAPDLPGAVMLDSVRVTSTGARLVRVETRPIERERYSIDQVDEWLAALEKVGDDVAVVSGKLAAVRGELQLLQGLQAAPPIPEQERVGKPLTPSPAAWRESQDRLAKRRTAARVSERELEAQLRALQLVYVQAQREVRARDVGGFSESRLEVLIIVDGAAGTGTLAVEYAVPGAFWKPSYDLIFSPDDNSVTLNASGLVSQASGEDWTNVGLGLSTAIPGQGIELPTLQTWTLGDDREFVPRAIARTTPRTTRPFQPPTPRPRAAEIERDADRQVLAQRTQTLVALAGSDVGVVDVVGGGAVIGSGRGSGAAYRNDSTIDFDSVDIAGDLAAPDGAAMAPRSKRAGRPSAAPPSMAPSAAAQPSEAMEDSSESESMPTTTSLSSMSRSNGASMATRALRLASAVGWRRPTFADPMLPAVTAGGLDVVYDAPLPATVPSNASGLRVPLASRRYDVATFYEATPSLSPVAYLKATVKNGSRLPILAGPANVFVGGAFVGDASLMTTGPGGTLELPLGADEDIRLTRTVMPSTKSKGLLFGEEDVTDYVVKIEVGNYKKRPITLRIIDQLPKTNAEKLKVELLSAVPQAREKPDGDGLLYWHADVPAGATRTITFTYRITRPKGWRLHQ